MRWPWSDRAPPKRLLAHPTGGLKCDECVTDKGRIRQLLEEIALQKASLTLLGHGYLPMIARISTESIEHNQISLTTGVQTDGFASEVTVHTRLRGIDLVFSGQLRATGTDEWALDLPDHLLYLNLRRHFRAPCAPAETIAFRTESGLTIQGTLKNLSEQGACVSLSAQGAEHLCASAATVDGQLVLPDLSLALGAMTVCHVDGHGEQVNLGMAFKLPEGGDLQRLRQAVHRRQVEDIQKKKAT